MQGAPVRSTRSATLRLRDWRLTTEIGIVEERTQVGVQVLTPLLHEVDRGAVEEDPLWRQSRLIVLVPPVIVASPGQATTCSTKHDQPCPISHTRRCVPVTQNDANPLVRRQLINSAKLRKED